MNLIMSGILRIQRVLNNLADGQEQQLTTNNRGDLSVVQALPPDAELVRLGNSWWVIQASAVTPVVALPTTTAQLSLFNGEQPGGNTYVIDSIFGYFATSLASAGNIGMCFMINPTKTVATAAGLTIHSLSGGPSYGGAAQTAVGATVVDNGWSSFGSSITNPTTTDATVAVDIPVKGLILIPPQAMLNVSVLAQTAAGTAQAGIRWHEVQLPINP